MRFSGVLNHDEITRRIENGELLRGVRRLVSGRYDVEPDSYDLTAGKAVWKEPSDGIRNGTVETKLYAPDRTQAEQDTLTVQPGQMVFVITHEDVVLPNDICATVYSRNNLAGEGILALNAGHVDPGFVGPIVIRLINLRATPWVLRLGIPIFTIVFQTLAAKDEDVLLAHAPIPAGETLDRVRKSAENALSNALFDLYAHEIQRVLLEHQSVVEARLRKDLADVFLKRADFGRALWELLRTSIITLFIVAGALAAILAVPPAFWKLLKAILAKV